MRAKERVIGSLRGAVFAIAMMSPAMVAAEGHIEVSLKAINPNRPGANVQVTVKNSGDSPVQFMEWDTPFPSAGGRLGRSIFEVTDATGKPVEYRGTWVNFGRLTMDTFRTIAPGEVLTKDINLAAEYRFKPNQTYQIRYVLNLSREPDPDAVPSAERAFFLKPSQAQAASETVTVFFSDVIASRTPNAGDDELICSVEQNLDIARSRLEATRHIYPAEAFMRNRYTGYLDDGKVKYRFNRHPRYERWFGAHNDSEPEFSSADWGLNNNARVYETVMATSRRFSAGAPQAKCGCPGYPPNVAAHVEKDTTYTMYFCEKFFELPMFDSMASKVGTLLHEYTHYNAYYPGTDDYLYGKSQVEKLAKENRDTAVLNADNFEFFFVDTTPYDE